MKKKQLILVAFLLMLYIAPMISLISYSNATIPTDQNTTKEFSISADWYNTSFTFRKMIYIEMATGIADTDYQVVVNTTYDADMNVDFSDLRFTDDDGTTLLDHW